MALPRGCYPEIRADDPYLIRARARIRTSCRFLRANLTSIPQYFGLHVHGLFTHPLFSVPLAYRVKRASQQATPKGFTTKNIS